MSNTTDRDVAYALGRAQLGQDEPPIVGTLLRWALGCLLETDDADELLGTAWDETRGTAPEWAKLTPLARAAFAGGWAAQSAWAAYETICELTGVDYAPEPDDVWKEVAGL